LDQLGTAQAEALRGLVQGQVFHRGPLRSLVETAASRGLVRGVQAAIRDGLDVVGHGVGVGLGVEREAQAVQRGAHSNDDVDLSSAALNVESDVDCLTGFGVVEGVVCSGQPIPDSGLSFSSATAGGNPSLN
ncbi:hypothetical protein ACF0C8_32120, partial [Pseudomonas aeruginosa]|uniref:hypothetical protein n=3 Tax=Pseudomonas aeruginosa TaxID=287 RepID=UPI001CBF4E14